MLRMPDGAESRPSAPADQALEPTAPRRPRYCLPADIADPPRHRVRLDPGIAADPSSLSLIRDRRTHVDTLTVNVKRSPPRHFRDALLAAQDGDPKRCFDYTPRKAPTLRKIVLQRPTLDAVALVAERPRWHQVARYHQAYDFIVDTAADAHALARCLWRGLCQKWPGQRHILIFEGEADASLYGSADAGTPRTYCVYVTTSPADGRPCARVEVRYETPEACRERIGIERIEDAIAIDPAALFARNFKWLELRDAAAFDAAVESTLDRWASRHYREAPSTRDPERYRRWQRAVIAHLAEIDLGADLPKRWSDLPLAFLRIAFPRLLRFHDRERPISDLFF
jgi:hypothetical protein